MKLFLFCVCSRQIHSLCEEKAQLAVAYETIKSLPRSHSPSPPLPPSTTTLYAINVPLSPTVSDNGNSTLSVNRTPNICVEDGRIEFVKENIDSGLTNNNNHNINHRGSIRHSRDEKIDNAKVSSFARGNQWRTFSSCRLRRRDFYARIP